MWTYSEIQKAPDRYASGMKYAGVVLLFLITLTGCANRDKVIAMGHWTGGFYSDKAEVLRGYLQLYGTGDKFKMRLANKDQGMNFDGTWTLTKKRITLKISSIDFENPTQETQKSLGLMLIEPESVRSAYAKSIVLDLAEDGRALKGLTMSIGRLQGSHLFTKGAVTENAQQAIDRMKSKD